MNPSASSGQQHDSETARFQVISDLHLEYGHQYSTYSIKPSAQYLILAGDTGSLFHYDDYISFLRRHCILFKHIYLVLGNHEFHGGTHEETLANAQRLESEKGLSGRLTVLHRRRIDVDRHVTLLGCTLWSSIPPEASDAVQAKVKDYRHIDRWTVERHNLEHGRDVHWLRDQLQKICKEDPERKVVVITHHAPSNHDTSNPIHRQNPWTPAFSTPLLEGQAGAWPGLSMIKFWIFGHTHWTTSFRRDGLTVLSNQRGYVSALHDHTPQSPMPRDSNAASKFSRQHLFDERTVIEV